MKNILKQSNLPFLLLILYIGKTFIQSASVFDSISIVVLSILFGFKLYLDHIKKTDFSQVFLDKIEELRKETKFNIAELDVVNKARFDKFDAKLSTVTLAVSTKTKGNSNEFKWGS